MLPSKAAWARLLLAIFGSYAIASLVAILPLALPVLSVSAIAWGRILAVVMASFSFVMVYLIESLAKAYGVMLTIIAGLLGLCVIFVPNLMVVLGGTS